MDRSLLLAASGLIAARVIDGLEELEHSSSLAHPSTARPHSPVRPAFEAEPDAGVSDEPSNAPHRLAPSNLYAGRLGAAVFLAAQALVADDGRSKETALRIADEIASATTEVRPEQAGIGGLVGLGGLIYGFTKIAQLTGADTLTDAARRLTTRLTAESIERDRHHDVVHGAAGTLLALLALPAPTEMLGDGASAVDRAELCANHLLRQCRRFDNGPPVWMSDTDPAPCSGFAHGAAGIAVALARLHTHRPRLEWLRAIFQALDFLRRHYDSKLDNWIPRATDENVFSLGWCHGAPGVAMAHLSIAADLTPVDLRGRSAEFECDVQAALAACRKHRPTPFDHLCCGNMSRAETFLVAHRNFGDAASLDDCHRFARWVLRSAKTHGRFVVPEDPSSAFSFFQGLAGVGYGFLRIAEPRRLPCVLLME